MDKFSEQVGEILKKQASERGVLRKTYFRIEEAVQDRQDTLITAERDGRSPEDAAKDLDRLASLGLFDADKNH